MTGATPRWSRVPAAQLVMQKPRLLHQRRGALQIALPRLRQPDLARTAVKELHAQRLLQRADTARQRRLRHIQLRCRPAETQTLRNLDKQRYFIQKIHDDSKYTYRESAQVYVNAPCPSWQINPFPHKCYPFWGIYPPDGSDYHAPHHSTGDTP